jgi:phosphohistidine phosphatase
MNLYIVRHAIAVEAGTSAYEADSLRPLTDKGKRKMEQIAQGLKELETEINLILTSPYLRAVETAKILRKIFDLRKSDVVETEHLSPVGYGDQLVQLINEKYSTVENIALVGHEPSLGILASMLIAGDPNLSITLKKGGICRLAVDTLQYGRCATLEWLLAPSQLAKLGK